MGQALCTCAGRADDEPRHGLYRGKHQAASGHAKGGRFPHSFPFKELSGHDSSLLQTQSRTETRELLSDEEREAMRNSVRVIHAGGHYHHHVHHGTGVYGYAVPVDDLHDHADATESDEAEYYNRQQMQQQQQQQTHSGVFTLALPSRRRPPSMMNQVTADAFRSKLREPIMSPGSKVRVLIGLATSDADSAAGDENAQILDENDAFAASAAPPAIALDETSSERDLRRLRCESAAYDEDPADDDEQDEEEEEEYFEFARIIVPPGPCGVVFQTPSVPGMPPTVEGFVKMYDGSKGPIENSGLVHPGSTLCAINDLEVETMPLPEVIRALNLSSHLEREFVFRK